ncbi:hypothetical protein ACJJTC_004858 [Scirpophaga incertulas]
MPQLDVPYVRRAPVVLSRARPAAQAQEAKPIFVPYTYCSPSGLVSLCKLCFYIKKALSSGEGSRVSGELGNYRLARGQFPWDHNILTVHIDVSNPAAVRPLFVGSCYDAVETKKASSLRHDPSLASLGVPVNSKSNKKWLRRKRKLRFKLH